MHIRGPVQIISTYEYSPVFLPPGLDTARTRERLEAAGSRAGLKVFETRDRRLHTRGVVGVIDIGEVIVEILPKIRVGASPSEGIAFLGNLLKFTGNEALLNLTEAGIAVGESGLLEIILTWAVGTIASNLKDGTPRRYTVCQETSTAVRGRVELRHIVQQRPGRSFELTVRHAPLSENNGLSRIVRWLVAEISRRTRSLRTRSLCLQLLQTLSHVADFMPTRSDLHHLTLSSMEGRWAPIVGLAKIFVDQLQPHPGRGGRLPSVAVLFTLHDLFEAALRRVLGEGLGGGLVLQRHSGHLLHSASGAAHLMRLRPDFRVGLSGAAATKIVGDAKWKSIFDGADRLNLRESDVYQVTAYISALGAQAGFIICPLLQSDAEIFRCSSFLVSGIDRPLDILGVQLAALIDTESEGANLRQRLCEAVVSHIPKGTMAV